MSKKILIGLMIISLIFNLLACSSESKLENKKTEVISTAESVNEEQETVSKDETEKIKTNEKTTPSPVATENKASTITKESLPTLTENKILGTWERYMGNVINRLTFSSDNTYLSLVLRDGQQIEAPAHGTYNYNSAKGQITLNGSTTFKIKFSGSSFIMTHPSGESQTFVKLN